MTQKPLAWIENAKKHLGLHETKGAMHHPTIIKWLEEMGKYPKANKAFYKDDETPWCGTFVGAMLGQAGRFVVPDWYRAKAWADERYLTKLSKPCYGCLGVKTRKGGGHVTFILGKDAQGYLMCIGGNQADSVCIVRYKESDFDSFWFPSLVKDGQCVKSNPAPERYNLPLVTANGKTGVSEA